VKSPEQLAEPVEKSHCLSQFPIFRDLTQCELEGLSRITAIRSARAGHIFYHPQDRGETLYLLLEGRVYLYRISPEGKKLILAHLGPGALFDEALLLNEGVHRNFAQSAAHSRVLTIDRMELRRLVLGKPSMALRVLELSCARLRKMEAKLESLAFRDMTSRIAEILLWLEEEQGSNQVIGFTHQDLADMVGVYRESITATLNGLRAQGCIDIGHKRIVILDRAQLAAAI
jgi:CRP/FNR family transcriptional regulator, cyclic AMP receptor protein